jgi:hypothetical protein
MRDIRFALEYAKADLLLHDWGIRSTIIVFGSARTPSPEQAEAAMAAAQNDAEREAAARKLQKSVRYTAARELGRIISERGGAFSPRDRCGTMSWQPAAGQESWKRPIAVHSTRARRVLATT